MSFRFRSHYSTAFVSTLTLALAARLPAQTAAPVEPGVQRLDPVVICDCGPKSSIAPYIAPQTTRSVDALQIAETINALDTEDAVKYLPSLFLRKRNYGDTQAVLATRVWGVSSSARSLVYADGVLLSALIANNNSVGGPRWGLVAPAEIERIDVLYGPFSAAYAGNSMGAVLEITTRQPTGFEASLQQTEAWQHFSQYGTQDDYLTHQTALTIGDRSGKFSYWISANYQDSHSQPLSYVTNATFPTGTTGGYAEKNKLGAPANIVGASGLLHTRMANAKVKLAYDLTPTIRAAYTLGLWRNRADSAVETYLRDPAGAPTFKGLAGFATGNSQIEQDHSSHSVSLQSDTKGNWDFSAVASLYHFDRDSQRSPTTASATGTTFGPTGRLAVLDGTGWFTFDLKAAWQPEGKTGRHAVSFGVHDDRSTLFNPTFNTAEWTAGPATTVATEGDGKTHTQALWAQDSIRLAPNLLLTLGARYEKWRGHDGYNVNGSTSVRQPRVSASNISPKAVLTWEPASGWSVTASVAKAYRYATAAELYQLVSTGTTFTSPNPDLKPDDVLATELRIERTTKNGRLQLALFQDEIHDAIISQFLPLVTGSPQLYSYLANVDHVRARGIEAVIEQRNVFIPGLEFTGSVTYLDARTLVLSGRASASAPADAAIGKRLPNIPNWRATFQLTYRPDARWSFSVAGRYSSRLYTTLDNADINPNTYQGFSSWFVADVRAHFKANERWSASLGVDNVLNREYFLFHPFPQRAVVADVKLSF